MATLRSWSKSARIPAASYNTALGIRFDSAAIGQACLFLTLFVLPLRALPAEVRRPEEVKAAFLYNFARFVEWPSEAFPKAETPLTIGVLGDDPVAEELAKIVRNDRVRNRPVVFRSYRRVKDIETCHVLYVSPSQNARLDEIADALKGRHILMVGEGDNFLRKGGIIEFVTERRVRLRVNLGRAKEEKLTISSQLLRLAEIENK